MERCIAIIIWGNQYATNAMHKDGKFPGISFNLDKWFVCLQHQSVPCVLDKLMAVISQVVMESFNCRPFLGMVVV